MTGMMGRGGNLVIPFFANVSSETPNYDENDGNDGAIRPAPAIPNPTRA